MRSYEETKRTSVSATHTYGAMSKVVRLDFIHMWSVRWIERECERVRQIQENEMRKLFCITQQNECEKEQKENNSNSNSNSIQ